MLYTFSTKTKIPADQAIVDEVKEHCLARHLNFSGLVVSLLRNYMKQVKLHEAKRDIDNG